MSTDKTIRWITATTVLALGLVAAVVSYQHALDVALSHGQYGRTAQLTPLTIDGVVLASGMVLLACAREGRRAPKLAYFTLALGIGATLAANGYYGASYGTVGIVVAAWPAVAFVFSTELFMGHVRRSKPDTKTLTAGDIALEAIPQRWHIADETAEELAKDAEPVDPAQALRDAIAAATRSAKESKLTQEQIAEVLGTNRHQVRKLLKPTPTPEPASINGHHPIGDDQ